MALTGNDKQLTEEAATESRLQALTDDIKETYEAIYGEPNRVFMSAGFARKWRKRRVLFCLARLIT